MKNKGTNLLFVYRESNEIAKNIAMKNVEKLLKENNKRTVVLHDEDIEKNQRIHLPKNQRECDRKTNQSFTSYESRKSLYHL